MFYKKKIARVLFVLLLPLVVRAEKAEELVCKDLHRAACASGDVTDPTGVSRIPTSESGSLSSEVRQELKQSILNVLKDPAQLKLRKALIKVAQAPECETVEGGDLCTETLSLALLSKIESRLITGVLAPHLVVGKESKISDLQVVLEAPAVSQLIKQMIELFKSKSGENDLLVRSEKEIFQRVKDTMSEQIQTLISDEAARAVFLARIKLVQWGGTGCGVESLPSILVPDVFLNPKDNKIYVCRGVARWGTSEYGIAYLPSRELATFLSPCNVARGKDVPLFKYQTPGKVNLCEKEFPFHGVLSCLRSRGSVFAQKGVGVSRETVAFCDKSDQISESFIDWLAIENMVDYIEKFFSKHSRQEKRSGIISLMRSQCMPGAGLEMADRTPIEERFNRLLLSNPDIRDQLGCTVKPLDLAYCAPESVSDSESAVGKSESAVENAAGEKKE